MAAGITAADSDDQNEIQDYCPNEESDAEAAFFVISGKRAGYIDHTV